MCAPYAHRMRVLLGSTRTNASGGAVPGPENPETRSGRWSQRPAACDPKVVASCGTVLVVVLPDEVALFVNFLEADGQPFRDA